MSAPTALDASPSFERNGLSNLDRARLALRRSEAAKAIGVSDEVFDRHVRPTLPCVRLASVTVYPVAALERWLEAHSSSPAQDVGLQG